MHYDEKMSKLVKLSPHVVEKVWGGKNLAKYKNWEISHRIGETWEVSTHSDGPSKVGEVNLNAILSLSYLVKFIDTTDNLSIQVHPDDEYAKQFNESGKTECWLILQAAEGAGIYLGFRPDVTRKEFKTAIENGLSVDKFLNFIPVQSGDFFFVPAGTIHAIGKGVTLCEVQQSSGITYRVWDWNRMGLDGKPRELHIEQAMDVLNFDPSFNQKILNSKRQNVFNNDSIIKLANHSDFKAQMITVSRTMELELRERESITVLEGPLQIDDLELNSYQSCIVEKSGFVNIHSKKRSRFLLVSE